MTRTNGDKYAEWAVRFIIAVICVFITIAFQRIDSSNRKVDAKLDRVVFDRYCDTQERIRHEQQKTNEEMLKVLYEIKGKITEKDRK